LAGDISIHQMAAVRGIGGEITGRDGGFVWMA